MTLVYLGIDAFLVGCLFGGVVWIIGYKTGRLRQMYASLTESFVAFEKWHRSWKSYKEPRVIRPFGPSDKEVGIEETD